MAAEQQFLAEIDHLRDDETSTVARKLIAWGPELTGQAIDWGTGVGKGMRGTVRIVIGGQGRAMLSLRATGDISLTFDQIRNIGGFGAGQEDELKHRLNRIYGMNITEDNYRDKFPMRYLADDDELIAFKEAWAWAVAQVKG